MCAAAGVQCQKISVLPHGEVKGCFMKKNLAFVLSGGGSRGAMQAGALRALVEGGYTPDMVCGTSIGAINGAFLAVHGFNAQGLQKLEQVWKTTVDRDLLPTNLWWQTMRVFFGRDKGISQQKILDFAASNGLTPELRFKDLQLFSLFLVAADLNTGSQVIFGTDPQDFVLESVLASMTIPPWIVPLEKDGRFLIDGGAVSNLPIEAALLQGATEIIALDLFNPQDQQRKPGRLAPMIYKLDKTFENRKIQLELDLAEARRVPVRRIRLVTEQTVPIWDFRQSAALIEFGYQLARQEMLTWKDNEKSSLFWQPDLKAALEGLRRFIRP